MPKRKYPIYEDEELMDKNSTWVKVSGFDNYYVSSKGELLSRKRTIILSNGIERIKSAKLLDTKTPNPNGYVYVCLQAGDRKKKYRLHRLVAETFIPNPNECSQVNHIDGDKTNNCVDNLEWCTQSYNVQHAYDNNLINHYKRPVLMIDMNTGAVIYEHESLKSAALYVSDKLTSFTSAYACIGMCCKGKVRFCYGYKWRYKNKR